VFTDRIRLAGKYAVLTGLDFNNGRVHIQPGGDSNRVTRNLFRNNNRTTVDLDRADFNRIDHNEFRDQQQGSPNGTRSIFVRAEFEDGASHCKSNRIDHNYFHDMPNQTAGNGFSTIQVSLVDGQHNDVDLLIDHNLLIACNGEAETIGIKATGVSFTHIPC
jgi:hypothetical protein